MKTIGSFFSSEYAVGVILIISAILAILLENSSFSHLYQSFLHLHIGFVSGGIELPDSLQHWVNDGLMAIFFLLVGIEIKREMVEGHLSKLSQVILPGVAALGGMIVPAAIFSLINMDNPQALAGWAIPSATDIAFAVGVLSLLGNRVPYALKIFLLTVAVIDDMGAIAIIAIFYSGDLDLVMLLASALALAGLMLLNWLGVYRRSPYILLGILLWYFIYHSGLHSTIAGVLLAFTIPIRVDKEKRRLSYFGVKLRPYYSQESPAARMEYSLSGIVSFIILPLFAFANSGVPLAGVDMSSLFTGVPLGVMAGLFVGKAIGIFATTFILFKTKLVDIPEGCRLEHFLGVSFLCGIGFTMSLFIVSLSFDDDLLTNGARLGILCGSIISAVVGYAFLHFRLAAKKTVAAS